MLDPDSNVELPKTRTVVISSVISFLNRTEPKFGSIRTFGNVFFYSIKNSKYPPEVPGVDSVKDPLGFYPGSQGVAEWMEDPESTKKFFTVLV
ncbi:hypothetical protein LEP1GSC060_0337 [Leptospira weilii serovar Ranarum str. ICFT]|uniref:Uncharacterized protein n=1 Tax=Leptospira weilii serovar Ranarum str. ICFT TaxID=1218598 RepID=N1WLK9_9LEPT|nr:hypothetical protein LEP1GSC060_0337 [Leptospira weilii serovar Ranarum str. ICFT]